jgi:ABC-type multidrug transport system ATPase subunit
MLSLSGVAKSFYDPGRGPVPAVDGIDLELGPGVVALMGANGAGKSTLLRLIATLLVPDRGRILVDGCDTVTDGAGARRRIGYLSTATRLPPRQSGREVLVFAAELHGLTGAACTAAIAAQCAAFSLDGFIDQRVQGLSTGQLQRINLARALIGSPAVVILDEPTTGLDLVTAHQVISAVQAMRDAGRLIILATHIPAEVEAIADRLVVVRAGRVVFHDRPAVLGRDTAFAAALLALVGDSARQPTGPEVPR